jgi:hypothetical protein
LLVAAIVAGPLLSACAAEVQDVLIPDLDPVTVKEVNQHEPVTLVAKGEAKAVVHLVNGGGTVNKLFQELVAAVERFRESGSWLE